MDPVSASPVLVDQVYRSLLGAIADGTLRPGQRILQGELAASLGVSRQPVSHALQLLKHQRLVQDSGLKGLEISPVDPKRIRQLYEVRAALDALSARLAAGHVAAGGAPEQVRRLRAALAAGRALGNDAKLTALVQADVAFHQALYELSGNPTIPETIDAQWPHLRRSMMAVLEAGPYRNRAWAEHAEIARLVLAGDPEGAGKAAYDHADNAGKETERRLLQEETPGKAGCHANPEEDRTMKLSKEQIEQYHEEGYFFIPEAFSPEEVAIMRDAAGDIFRTPRQEIWLEKSGAPRTAFACHTYNDVFRTLSAHPRLVEPVEQVFGEACYVHQFKVNAKSAFSGDVWQWHQDFATWHNDDGMPEPRAMNISVFLDDVMPINGPLMLVPKSHKSGALAAGHDTKTTAYPLWTLDNDRVAELVSDGGIVAPTGKAGGLLMFNGNLVHGSSGNITPYPRKIVYLTLSAVSNAIRKPTRPEWISHQDFTPITALADDALMAHAPTHRMAAE